MLTYASFSVDGVVDPGDSCRLLMIDLAQHELQVGKASTQLDSLPTRHQTRHKSASISSFVEELNNNCFNVSSGPRRAPARHCEQNPFT